MFLAFGEGEGHLGGLTVGDRRLAECFDAPVQ